MSDTVEAPEGVLTYEMRRNTDGVLIFHLVLQPGQRFAWEAPPGFRAIHPGWPTGYHWRLLKSGRVAAQWPCSTKSDRADDEDEAGMNLGAAVEQFRTALKEAGVYVDRATVWVPEGDLTAAVRALLAAGWTPPEQT